jgi:hypothetical protein
MTDADCAARVAYLLRQKSLVTRESSLCRDEGVSLVAQTIERRMRRKRSRRLFWAATAGAAVLSVIGWRGITAFRQLTIGTSATAAACAARNVCVGTGLATADFGVADGHPVEPGARISAPPERASKISLGSGTRITLGAGSRLSYDEGSATHRFSLLVGSIHLEVAKQAPKQRFLVDTPDCEIEVRGTVFDVNWRRLPDPCGNQTQVSVTEGAVEVRHQGKTTQVRAGQSWPKSCPSQQQPAALPKYQAEGEARKPSSRPDSWRSVTATANAETPSAERAHPSSDHGQSSAARGSDLAEQNDLFARASAAQRASNPGLAIRLYDELLTRFPQGPLTESAISSRLALLKSSDPMRARSEARRYIETYPAGFSVRLAERILKEPL